MCVIIQKPAKAAFDDADVKSAFERNSHGFGLMYYDSEQKRIIAKKGLFKDIPKIQEMFKELNDVEACFHFRITTHGPTNDEMCHPFQVLDKQSHGMDMFMMHNGVINKVNNGANESDTYAFVRDYLRPMLETNPLLIENAKIRHMIEEFIGTGSKLVFMYGDGKIVKCNEKQGDEYKGCWVSNKHFVPYTGRAHSHYSGYDDSEYGSYGYQVPARSRGMTTTTPTRTLRNIAVELQDKVHVYCDSDDSFYAEGEINFMNGTNIWVTFNDGNKKCDYSFDPVTGRSTERHDIKKTYQIFADMFGQKSALESKKVKDLITEKEEEREEIMGELLKWEDDTVRRPLEFHSKDYRWGGDCLDGAQTEYGGEEGAPKVTILDVYNMKASERFKFFMDYPEIAFGMFQDMVEFITLEDPEVEWEEAKSEEVA